MSVSWLTNLPGERISNAEALAAVESVHRTFKLIDDDSEIKTSLNRAQAATHQFVATSNVKTILYEVRKYLTSGPVPVFPAAEGTVTFELVNKTRESLTAEEQMTQSQAHNLINTLPNTMAELVATCRAMDFELKSYDQVYKVLNLLNALREHFTEKLRERQQQQQS